MQDARSRDEVVAALFRKASDAADWAVPPERRAEELIKHALNTAVPHSLVRSSTPAGPANNVLAGRNDPVREGVVAGTAQSEADDIPPRFTLQAAVPTVRPTPVQPVRKDKSAAFVTKDRYPRKWLLFFFSLLCLHLSFTAAANAQTYGETSVREWEEKQRKKAEKEELDEIERLSPEVEKLAIEGVLEEVESMVETLRYSRVLGEEAKKAWIDRLTARKVTVLSAKANAQLNKGEIERARATIQKAETDFHALGEDQKREFGTASASLAESQYRYFIAVSNEIKKNLRRKNFQQAERMYHKTLLIFDATSFADRIRAEHAQKALAAVGNKLRNAQIKQTLLKAKRAESKGDIRIARLLYETAARDGRSPEAARNLKRLEEMRLNPGLNLGLSIVVPGLGQLNSRRILPAAGFFFGTALALGGGMVLAISAENRYDQYQAATNPEKAASLYDGINTRWNMGLVLFGTAAALYIWNLIDVYVSSVNYNRENF
ncbi:MAG: hypothetical protein JXA30_11570 [Deltaproteobacteria bacterium]|nr:hypothetical protein [Deltaproteobacteria bacterium]